MVGKGLMHYQTGPWLCNTTIRLLDAGPFLSSKYVFPDVLKQSFKAFGDFLGVEKIC